MNYKEEYVVMDINANLWIMKNFGWIEGWLCIRDGNAPMRLRYGSNDGSEFFICCLGEL